jgi:hypothetical protein
MLGMNLIKAQASEDNVVAMMYLVKEFTQPLEYPETEKVLLDIVERRNPISVDEPKPLSQYSYKDLLQLAIMKFDSDLNIDYAQDVYITYIKDICTKAKTTKPPKADADDQRSSSDK